jgi:hypothetical protein
MNPILAGLFSTPVAGIYGATEMAKNQGNAMMGNYNLANQNNLNLENYMTLDGTTPVVDEGRLLSDTNYFASPRNINYPNLGKPLYPPTIQPRVYPPTIQPRVPDYISSSERPAYQDQPGFFKQAFNKVKGVPLGLLNLITRRQGADQSFAGYPGGAESRAGLFPREVQNLQAVRDAGYLGRQGQDIFGTNIVSQFGDYDKAMAKNLGVFQQTMADKGFKDLDELEDYYEQYGDRSYILNKLRHVRGMTGQSPEIIQDKTTTDIIPAGTTGGVSTPRESERARQGGYNPSSRSFSSAPGGLTQAESRAARGDPTGTGGGWKWAQGGRVGYDNGGILKASYGYDDAMGESWEEYKRLQKKGVIPIDMEFEDFLDLQQEGGFMEMAQGGRIGYRDGEFVEDINIEGPGYDVNEQMAGFIDPMDALNDMSMNVFGKPLNELTGEEYQMLIDMANDQAMGEQDQGIASLV